jgi:CBS domain-containing protein
MSTRTILRVHDIMSNQVLTIRGEEPLSRAVARIVKYDVGSILVIDDREQLMGIITKGDVLRKLVMKGLNPKDTPSSKVMSKPVVSIDLGATVEEASKVMTQRKVSKLPVLDGSKLVGIITSTDIIRTEPAQVAYLQELVRARFVPQDLR